MLATLDVFCSALRLAVNLVRAGLTPKSASEAKIAGTTKTRL
jgi:hypothetical protein